MINKVILVGRLGKDPEVRHFEGDSMVAIFSVATDDGYYDKNAGQRVEKTEWVNVVLWNGLGSVAEKYLRKGSQVYIEGKITSRKYQDKEGNDRYITEVKGLVMKMLGSRGDNGSANVSSSTSTTAAMPQAKATTPPVAEKTPTAVAEKETLAPTEKTPAPVEKAAEAPAAENDDLPF